MGTVTQIQFLASFKENILQISRHSEPQLLTNNYIF